MGPYFNSEDNLNKYKNTTSITADQELDKNGRVRFKDDSSAVASIDMTKPNPILKNNISYPNTYEQPRNLDRMGGAQTFMPLAKIPVNFNPSFIRHNNTNNSIRETRTQEQIYSLSDSLSDSNNLQLSNKDLSSLDIKEKRESFENLYTQVQPQATRNSMRVPKESSIRVPKESSIRVPKESSIRVPREQSVRVAYNRQYNDDAQPVYMNTQ